MDDSLDVFDQDDRRACGVDIADQVDGGVQLHLVETGTDLIQEQEAWVGGQRFGDLQAFEVKEGQAAG